jgi:hypothetical protein
MPLQTLDERFPRSCCIEFLEGIFPRLEEPERQRWVRATSMTGGSLPEYKAQRNSTRALSSRIEL